VQAGTQKAIHGRRHNNFGKVLQTIGINSFLFLPERVLGLLLGKGEFPWKGRSLGRATLKKPAGTPGIALPPTSIS